MSYSMELPYAIMASLFDYISTTLQSTPGLGSALLIVLILLSAIAFHRFNYRKHIDSNGKVVVTPRYALPKIRPSKFTSGRMAKKAQPAFSVNQRRLLSVLYAVHEAMFGAIVILCGLTLLSAAMISLTEGSLASSYVSQVIGLLMGVLAIPLGILFIVLRNADNPFK